MTTKCEASRAIAWRLVWKNGFASNWRSMPARKVKPSDGGARIEFAYSACVHCNAFPVKHACPESGSSVALDPFMRQVVERCATSLDVTLD